MMKTKVENAVNQLNRILPLKDRQDHCRQEIKAIHQQILRSFVDNGRCLIREEMGANQFCVIQDPAERFAP